MPITPEAAAAAEAAGQAQARSDANAKAAAIKAKRAAAGADDGAPPAKKPCKECERKIKCFSKPDGATDEEFERQLKEQEDAINSQSADALLQRHNRLDAAGSTKGVRENSVQRAAKKGFKKGYQQSLQDGGMLPSQAKKAAAAAASGRHATHTLDIVAGGDATDISGMGDGSVNSSMGAQWKGARAAALRRQAQDMHDAGKGDQNMNVKLEKC